MSATYSNEPVRRVEPVGSPRGGPDHVRRRVSWAAIFGGVVMVITVQLLLSLLGAGIGFTTVDAQAGTAPDASSIGIGAGVWFLISSVVALAFGGYVSAWLAGIGHRFDGRLLHGLITWGIATMLTMWLLTSAIGGIIGGSASALGGLASTAGNGIKSAAQPVAEAAGITPDLIQQQAQMYLKPTNPDPATMSPHDAQKEIATNLATYAKGGPDAATAKTRIIAIMAAQQHISPDQAGKQFDDAQAKVEQAKAQVVQAAKTAADAAASAASRTAFGAFVALLVGAIAAAIGGSVGIQSRAIRGAVV
ncbi:MAG: hypothetical protein ACRYF2_00290 [Janthinobacterium lividum]